MVLNVISQGASLQNKTTQSQVAVFKWNEMENQKIPPSRNNSKIKYQNRRKRQNLYHQHTNTWPLTFLARTHDLPHSVRAG